MYICGIDYSLTSPSMCIHPIEKSWSWSNCKIFYITSVKKSVISEKNILGICYPEYQTQQQRYSLLADFFISHLIKHRCNDVTLENYAFQGKGKVFNIAENTGVLKHKLWELGLTVSNFAPTEIKKFATGKGNASKRILEEFFVQETRVDIRTILNQSEKTENPSSDVVDSYYICKLAYENRTTLVN